MDIYCIGIVHSFEDGEERKLQWHHVVLAVELVEASKTIEASDEMQSKKANIRYYVPDW